MRAQESGRGTQYRGTEELADQQGDGQIQPITFGGRLGEGFADAVLDGVAVQIQLLGGMEMTLLGGQEH